MVDPIQILPPSASSFTSLPLNWYGQPARYRAEYRLSLDNATLRFDFRCDKPAQFEIAHHPGEFVEGLWEQDVAELFVMGPEGMYQEFNVSPGGAWWCAVFSTYREQERTFQCPSVVTRASSRSECWTAGLSLELSDLLVLPGGDLSQARLQVASILCSGQPEYLCSGHSSGGEPDFHRAENFRPVRLA
jgi:hypothetical protein